MTALYAGRRADEFRYETNRASNLVLVLAGVLNLCSAFFAAGATYLHFAGGSDSLILSVLVSALAGLMTGVALFTFTTAIVRLMPRFDPKRQMIGGAIALAALVATCAISGTSNAVFLGYFEARSREEEKAISRGEEAFALAQISQRELQQIKPLLTTGRETASRLKELEARAGLTGAGKGPIHAELVTQESRLSGAEDSVSQAILAANSKIAEGQSTLAEMRKMAKDESLSREDRQRAIENGLTRLAGIVIGLRQAMPISSLDAIASMLEAPIELPNWSTNPEIRQHQLETVARLHQEFEPVGSAIKLAVRTLGERLPKDVAPYEHKSPTAMVFSNAGDLAWLIAVGYSLDILPYLALGLVLLAHRQLDSHERGEEDAILSKIPAQRHRANGHMQKHDPQLNAPGFQAAQHRGTRWRTRHGSGSEQ